jgi:hypothetical protein
MASVRQAQEPIRSLPKAAARDDDKKILKGFLLLLLLLLLSFLNTLYHLLRLSPLV